MPEATNPDPVNTRVNYFNGQFLDENDFRSEQAYQQARRQRLALALAGGPGIVAGLTVKSGQGSLRVAAGLAIDASGHELVLTEAKVIPTTTAGNYQAVIQPPDESSWGFDTDEQTKQPRRINETPQVKLLAQGADLPKGAIVLAQVTLGPGGAPPNIVDASPLAGRPAAGGAGGESLWQKHGSDIGYSAGNVSIGAAASQGKRLLVTGGDVQMDRALTVGGLATFNGGLAVAEPQTLPGKIAPVIPALTVTGDTTLNGGLSVSGKLKLSGPLAIDTFTNDLTSGGGDQAVPTANAVKTYVDNALQGKTPNGSSALPETVQFLHIKADESDEHTLLLLENGKGWETVNLDFRTYSEKPEDDPEARISAIDRGAWTAHLAFYTKQPGTDASAEEKNKLLERLRITREGNVGIGTTKPGEERTTTLPQERLTVQGSTSDASKASLNVTDAEKKSLLYVRNDGYVGIGANQPSAQLEVKGSLKLSGAVVIKKFSNDGKLGDGDDALPTVKAVKAYVDNKLLSVGQGAPPTQEMVQTIVEQVMQHPPAGPGTVPSSGLPVAEAQRLDQRINELARYVQLLYLRLIVFPKPLNAESLATLMNNPNALKKHPAGGEYLDFVKEFKLGPAPGQKN